MNFGDLLTDTGKKFINDIINLIVFFLVGIILSLTIVLIPSVTAGFTREFLNYARHGKKPDFKELWNFSGYLTMLLLLVAGGTLIVLGFMLLIVPGVILSVWWLYSCFFIVEQNMGFWEAMCASKKAVSASGFINHFAIFLILIVLEILGSFAAGLGSIVTAPFGMLLLAQVYIEEIETKNF